jgi:4-amino-4-deoxy-L-arabinose transferase-like glycosyltransferase
MEIRMGLKTKENALEWAFMGLVMLALLLFKLPQLSLPCFWDEAWSYLPAILKMAETGPTLIPDPQNAVLFRGHPLFFYALASVWIMVFGHSFVAMRLLPLVISMLLLIVLFRFAKKHFGRKTAMIATLFLLIQSLFLAQSSMILPEMLLALLSLLALDTFLAGKKGLFILWATLLVFTKETGVVLVLTCLLVRFRAYEKVSEGKSDASFLRSEWPYLLPLAFIGIFFLLQRVIMGWFFFPEHVGLIKFSAAEVLHRLQGYSSFLFIGYGRNLLTFGVLAALGFAVIRKVRIEKTEYNVIAVLLLYMFLYILFLSINFYSPRYLLSIFPVFILLSVFIIIRMTEKYPLAGYAVLIVILANNLWFTWSFRRDADNNLGYADATEVQSELVRYVDSQSWQSRYIATHFLMSYYLTHPDAGYVTTGREFLHVATGITDSTSVAIISSTEYNKTFKESIKQRNPVLVRRFEKRGSWSEVYLIK